MSLTHFTRAGIANLPPEVIVTFCELPHFDLYESFPTIGPLWPNGEWTTRLSDGKLLTGEQYEMFAPAEVNPQPKSFHTDIIVKRGPFPPRFGKHCLVYCGPERCDCGKNNSRL